MEEIGDVMRLIMLGRYGGKNEDFIEFSYKICLKLLNFTYFLILGVAMNFNLISLKPLKEIGLKNFACPQEGNKTQILDSVISFQSQLVAKNITEMFVE